MNVIYQNKTNVELTYLVFRPLPCQGEEQLRPLHHPTLLKTEAVVVWKAVVREDGYLLAVHGGIHGVDGRDAGLDRGIGVVSGEGVDGYAVDASGNTVGEINKINYILHLSTN